MLKTKTSFPFLAVFAVFGVFGVFSVYSQNENPEVVVEEAADGDPKSVWTASDTRLANHYLRLLQQDPAYGNVFDLLWNLYEKKNQTPLLLDYLKKASEGDRSTPKVIYAHLLRKSGSLDEARAVYSTALEIAPEGRHALQALAELNDREKRFGKALSLYTRLAAVVPLDDEDGVAMRLRKAELHRMQGQNEEAVFTWDELLKAYPERNDLRSRIVALLLEIGETGTARRVLGELSESKDPREKVEALLELTRLNELISDFDGARDAAKRGLAILHFKTHDYADLFSRLVQIHERFEKLELLEEELEKAGTGETPSERALFDLAEFYRLTADPAAEEAALNRLVKRMPRELEYRLRLTRVLMRNDRYDAAAEVLEVAFEGQEKIPLHLLLLRSQIALNDDDKKGAEEIVEGYLVDQTLSEKENQTVIDFARENYLDQLVESLLSRQMEGSKEGGDRSAPIELARFLHERGRKSKARETLEAHVEGAEGSPKEKTLRLQQMAAVLRDLGDLDRALGSIESAMDLDPDNLDFLTTRADILVDSGKVEKAIEQLEEIWKKREGFRQRADIDQRLFSLMRGHYSTEPEMEEELGILKNGNIQSLAQYRRLAAAASRVGRPGDEPPPAELMSYYEDIKNRANDAPTVALRYRAAWWAFKLQDNQECYEQLVKATAEAGKPMVPVEQMLLELAVLNERPTLMVKHLSTLAEIDPDNEDEYLQRRAEMRFELGFEDEAVRELNRLAAKPEASLNTLATLSKVYQRQGSSGKQVEVWQRAYRDANIFEKRRIVKQLSTALMENGRPKEALEAQMDLIERESDELQRRKQLDTQLTGARSNFLLEWLLSRYADLAQQKPFDAFYPEALARVHLAAGDEDAAFKQLKKAYYMSGQRSELLDELSLLSDNLGDLKSAIYYRRQLLARDEEDDLEHWLTLVTMLEKDLRVDEAERLRKRLESKFGRDPEFLEELATTYLDNGDPAAAERTLEKLLSLREWDRKIRFRLAFLQQSRGKDAEALVHYENLLEATKDLSFPEEIAKNALPLIRVLSNSLGEAYESGTELYPFIFSIEEFPFLGGDLQDDLAEGLQEPHPEFHSLPEQDHYLRLRALEEASVIARELGRAGEWSQPFLDPDRPLIERIWVARHTGNQTILNRLIQQREWGDSTLDRFLAAYFQVLCGEKGDVDAWIAPDPVREEGDYPRSRYVEIAAFLLLKDAPRDPLADREWLFSLFERLSIHPKMGEHFFTELRKARRFEEALQIGRGLAEDELKDQGGFLFALSQVAGWTGDSSEKKFWLSKSFDLLQAGSRNRSDGYFYTALTEMMSLLEDDVARAQFLRDLLERSKTSNRFGPLDLLEREILIALAGKQEMRAVNLLGDLVQRQLTQIRPRSGDADQVRYDQIQSWQRMEQLIRYYAYRVPVRNPETRAALFEVLRGNLSVIPRDESVLAEYEQYEIDRRILEMEGISRRERVSAVAQLRGILREPDSHLELARGLESVGFHESAIPVFRAEAMKRDRDYAPLQGLFSACNEALEPSSALLVIDQIHSREFPAPPGLTSEYLAEQQARFLFHGRDLERLTSMSQPPQAGAGKPPISSEGYIPYRAALIEVYRMRGNHEALLRILSEDRSRKKIEKRHLLLGAQVLADQGRSKEALNWIEEILKDSAEPALERKAILLAIKIHERDGWSSPSSVVELAQTSMASHPINLTRELSETAFLAGAENEAVSILKLLRRKTLRPSQRSGIAGQLLQMRMGNPDQRESLRSEWEAFFRDFVYVIGNPGETMESVRAGVPATNAGRFVTQVVPHLGEGDQLEDVIAETPTPPQITWLRDLLLASLRGEMATTAASLLADSKSAEQREQILETLPSFGEEGIAAARSYVGSASLRGTQLFAHEPFRQILFFHAIGERNHLLEVHQQLMQEAESDLFHQTGLDLWFPTLTSRYRVPLLLAEIGESDLALRLYRRYHEDMNRYRWHHKEFLESYLAFLIDQNQFEEGQEIAERVFAKSLRVDLRLLVRLHDRMEVEEPKEAWISRFGLSEGEIALVDEWSSALAEGREMVEYSDTW